jgi:hypothetical protein
MNNLIIAVILIAVGQVLTIILTMGREREIKRLRELVTEHRVQIAEIKAWLAGRMQSAQPRRIKSDREPTADDIKVPEPVITPKDSPEAVRPSTPEDELKRATKANDWSREIVAGLQAGLQLQRGAPPVPAITRVPEPATTPKDLSDAKRPSTTEDELKRATKAINWLNEDVDKARATIAAQQVNRTGPVMPLEMHKAEEVDAEADPPSLRRKT